MKKFILGVMMVGAIATVQVGLAMEKEKKEIKTSLSDKQVSELRQAVKDYKANKSRSTQEKIVNKYKNKYPNDPFVKAKLNEKARFDNPQQPIKESKTKEMPNAQPPVKKEKPVKKQPIIKPEKPQVKEELLGYYGPKEGWLEHELSTNSKQQVNGTPNMRVANKSSQRILIGIHDRFWTKGTEKKVIEPQQTISFYIADADKDASEWPVEIYVQELKNNVLFARNGYGLSDIQPVSKGQIIDLEYKDDHTFFPKTYDKMEQMWFGGESKRHLYQVRNGKKVERNTEK